MRYDGEHKARVREAILGEAAQAIRTDGAERISVAAVMARVGLTHGGFYAHFRSKDDLVAASITHMFEDRYKAFFDLTLTAEPLEVLQRFVRSYLSMAHCDSRALGCPLPILAGEVHRLSGEARRRYETGLHRLIDAVATLLTRLGIEADLARLRAATAVAQMVGAISVARALDSRAEAAALLRTMRSIVMAALVPADLLH